MVNMVSDPYEGIESEDEKLIIYQNLLKKHQQEMIEYEKAEHDRNKVIYDNFMVAWYKQRDIQKDLDNRFNKNIIMLAAGSFGVSFAFISQIVNLQMAVSMQILVIAWALFAGAIVTAVLDLKMGSVIQDFLLNIIEENIKRGYEGKPYKEPKKWFVNWVTRIFGWVSLISFILGVICLLNFVLINTRSL